MLRLLWISIYKPMSFSIFSSRLVSQFSILVVVMGPLGSTRIVTSEVHQNDWLHMRNILF
jgi:hypothetical protein